VLDGNRYLVDVTIPVQAAMRIDQHKITRRRTAYKLYQQYGYVDMNVSATSLARRELAHQPTRLNAQSAVFEGFDFVETLFRDIAGKCLGFAWRQSLFARLRVVTSRCCESA